MSPSRKTVRSHPRRLAGVVGAIVLLAMACSSSPTPRFYAIKAMDPAESSAGPGQVGVAVGPIQLPRYLQRPQIVSRKGDSALRYDQFNRWGGSLESEALRVLGENLGVLLATDRIVVYPTQAAFPTPYTVRVDFERFEGTPGEELVLKGRWVILPESRSDALAVEVTTVRVPLEGDAVDELVRAHGTALETLARAIASRIQELETGTGGEPAAT